MKYYRLSEWSIACAAGLCDFSPKILYDPIFNCCTVHLLIFFSLIPDTIHYPAER